MSKRDNCTSRINQSIVVGGCTIIAQTIIDLFVTVFADIGVSIWRRRFDHDGLQKDGLPQQARQ